MAGICWVGSFHPRAPGQVCRDMRYHCRPAQIGQRRTNQSTPPASHPCSQASSCQAHPWNQCHLYNFGRHTGPSLSENASVTPWVTRQLHGRLEECWMDGCIDCKGRDGWMDGLRDDCNDRGMAGWIHLDGWTDVRMARQIRRNEKLKAGRMDGRGHCTQPHSDNLVPQPN